MMACILFLPEILADQDRFQVERARFDDGLALPQSVRDLHQIAHRVAGGNPPRFELSRSLADEHDRLVAHFLNGAGGYCQRSCG